MPATVARRESAQLPEKTISPLMTFMFASACGLVAANLYYGQPLAGPISQALGFTPAATGLIVTLTQIGYGLGLLLIVPLGDLLENRRLVLTLIGLSAVALVGAAFAWSPSLFLLASLCIGLASVAVQVLVPFAAHMAPDASRGAVVGNVMSGLLCGIMLARPAASFLSELSSWHAVYILSAGVMLGLAVILRAVLPTRVPHTKLHYGQLLSSMGHLALHTPVLQRRALYQACMFGAFSLFWTTTPLLLASPAFGLTQNGIALFALAGAAGAVASPIAGRVADRGWTKLATAFAMVLAIVALLIGHASGSGSLLALMTLTLSGDPARFRRADQSRARPARHLCAQRRTSQPPERSLHGDILCRRRARLGNRRLGLCHGRLESRLLDRHLLPGRSAAHLPDRTAKVIRTAAERHSAASRIH